MLRLDADNKRISLKSGFRPRSLRARENHIERLVENLVGNAINTPRRWGGSRSCRRQGGPSERGGFRREYQPIRCRVFEEFYRADNVRKSHEGTGLVLRWSKLVDLYGARFGYPATGAGTTFVVTWPDAALEPEHGAEPVSDLHSPRRILRSHPRFGGGLFQNLASAGVQSSPTANHFWDRNCSGGPDVPSCVKRFRKQSCGPDP